MQIKKARWAETPGERILEITFDEPKWPVARITTETHRWWSRALTKDQRVVNLGKQFKGLVPSIVFEGRQGKQNEPWVLEGYTQDPTIIKLTEQFLDAETGDVWEIGERQLP